nr:hypothetical protein [Saprospiraceae bacterium]
MKTLVFTLFSALFIFPAMGNTQLTPVEKVSNEKSSTTEGVALSDLSADQVVIKVTGTGETTGHILNLHLKNLTRNDILINIPPYYVPSDGEHQSYVLPLPGTVRLRSNSEIIHPLKGYCTDVNTPPVPSGEPTLLPHQWIRPDFSHFDQNGYHPDLHPGRFYKPHISTPTKTSDPDYSPDKAGELLDGIFITPIGKIVELQAREGLLKEDYKTHGNGEEKEETTFDHLGVLSSEPIVILPTNALSRAQQHEVFRENKGVPFMVGVSGDRYSDLSIIQFDPKIQPEITADLFYDAVVKITAAADDIMGSGELLTPYSHQPGKERESIIQHTLWRYTSAVTGISYKKSDFREQLLDQFHEMSGMEIEEAPDELQHQFESGVSIFWDAFTSVGERAKVFKRGLIKVRY